MVVLNVNVNGVPFVTKGIHKITPEWVWSTSRDQIYIFFFIFPHLLIFSVVESNVVLLSVTKSHHIYSSILACACLLVLCMYLYVPLKMLSDVSYTNYTIGYFVWRHWTDFAFVRGRCDLETKKKFSAKTQSV